MDVTVEAGWLGAQLREVECRARWRAGSAGRKARLPGAPTEYDGHDNGTGNADRRLMDVPRDGAGRQVAHGEGERDVTGARVDGHCDGAVAALALGGVSFAPDNVVVSWQPPGGRLASTFRLKIFRIFGGPFPREQREDRGSFPRSHFRRTVLGGGRAEWTQERHGGHKRTGEHGPPRKSAMRTPRSSGRVLGCGGMNGGCCRLSDHLSAPFQLLHLHAARTGVADCAVHAAAIIAQRMLRLQALSGFVCIILSSGKAPVPYGRVSISSAALKRSGG